MDRLEILKKLKANHTSLTKQIAKLEKELLSELGQFISYDIIAKYEEPEQLTGEEPEAEKLNPDEILREVKKTGYKKFNDRLDVSLFDSNYIIDFSGYNVFLAEHQFKSLLSSHTHIFLQNYQEVNPDDIEYISNFKE